MRCYSVSGKDTNTANTTILGLTGATTIRPEIYDILVGPVSTPNDYAAHYVLQRYTAAGTSTSVTPTALDPGDPAATATAGKAHTAEPTYTANAILLEIPKNMRPTIRWVAQQGRNLKIPAVANNGIGFQCLANFSSVYDESVVFHFEE